MVYDPQAKHRRPHPEADERAPVDAILGDVATATGVPEDPPPTPTVTPVPADPPSDTVLLNTGLAAAIATLVALLMLRQLWNRRRRNRAAKVDG